jgi:transposase
LLGDLLEAGDEEHLVETLTRVFDSVSGENDALRMRISQLTQRVYGRSSEKVDPNQLRLALEELRAQEFAQQDEDKPEVEPDEPIEPDKPKPKRRTKPHPGRNPLPAALPREERRHTIPKSERTCTCCKKQKVKIREEVCERLDYRPASLVVIKDINEVWGCNCLESTPIRAKAPQRVIEGGLPEPGLLAKITVAKYKDSLPLHRQAKIFAREGVTISPKTMGDWIRWVAWWLAPLHRLINERVLRSWIISSDDTGLCVLDKNHVNGARRGRLWANIGDSEYVVYHYSPNWKHEHPARFLKGVAGYLQTDGYKGYDALCDGREGKAIRVGCWMHARRYFVKAFQSGEVLAAEPLDLIQQLYKVERESKDEGEDHEARQQRRVMHSTKLLDKLGAWLRKHEGTAPPKTGLGKAMTYLSNQWDGLGVFVHDGRLELDNGAVERALRGIAVGRHNWLFAGSDAGAEWAAIIYTVIETAVMNGVEPFMYIRDVLAKLGAGWPNKCLDELLPARWAALYGPRASESTNASIETTTTTLVKERDVVAVADRTF